MYKVELFKNKRYINTKKYNKIKLLKNENEKLNKGG